MLKDTLLGIVESINDWVLQSENAGVLNFLLNPATTPAGSATEFEQAANIPDNALQYLKAMLLYTPLNLPVLQVIPVELGGGQRGLKFAHENPNQEPAIFWITIAAFLVILALIIFLQIINCCCCDCGEKSINVS